MPPRKADTLPPSSELWTDSFSFLGAHYRVLMLITSVPAIIGLALAYYDNQPLVSVPLMVGLVLASMCANVAAVLAIIDVILTRGKPLDGAYGAYRRAFTNFWQLFFAYVVITFATLGGFMLLAIPGFIVAALLIFSSYIIVSENKNGLDALITSWHYASGYVPSILWRFFFLLATFAVIFLGLRLILQDFDPLWVDMLAVLLNNYLFLPLGMLFGAYLYGDIRKKKESLHNPSFASSVKKQLIVLTLLGAIGIIALAYYATTLPIAVD